MIVDRYNAPKHTGLHCDECGGEWSVYSISYPFDPEGWVQHYCSKFFNAQSRIIARPAEIGQEAINLVWLAKYGSKVHALQLMEVLPKDDEWWLGA